MAGAIALALVFCAASVVVFFAISAAEGKPRPRRFDSLEALRAAAILFAPVWVLLVGHVLWALWGLASEFNPSVQDGDLRWHALAFVGLITSLLALISAPLALIRVWTTERQTRTAEQGHMTDRISKAVEQLGTEKTVKVIEDGKSVEKTVPNIEVRIGALSSLERIAQDSVTYDRGRDHVRVMQILCAYLRENAPSTGTAPTADLERRATPRMDIEIAINVIKGRNREQVELEVKSGFRLNLHSVCFDGCDLSKANLSGALLYNCRFEAANLSYADLTGAQMEGALIDYAHFLGTTLRGTNLNRCIFSKSNFLGFSGADLQSCWIEDAEMPALIIVERTKDHFFGSRNTKLSERQNAIKEAALNKVSIMPPEDLQAEDPDSAEYMLEGKENLFARWNPFEARDGAAPEYRSKFIALHKLYGWPFTEE